MSKIQPDTEYLCILFLRLNLFGALRYFSYSRPQSIAQLEKYIGTEWEECVWFFISNFAVYSSLSSKISDRCLEQFEKFHLAGEYPSFMEYVVKVLMHIFQRLSTDKLARVQSK